MEKNYWKILFKHTSNYGLTIPNIIGSKKILMKTNKLDTVDQLFSRIIDDKSNSVLIFKYCTDIGEYVFTKAYQDYLIKGLNIINKETNTIKIVLAENTKILGKDLSEIKFKLHNRYANKINEERYSFNKYTLKFEKFTEEEIEYLKKITIANNGYQP